MILEIGKVLADKELPKQAVKAFRNLDRAIAAIASRMAIRRTVSEMPRVHKAPLATRLASQHRSCQKRVSWAVGADLRNGAV